jgi:undecaprenyl-diphosphatase
LDFDLYERLNGLADRHHALAEVFRFIAQDGQVLFLVLLAALFFARGKWRSRNGRHGVAAAGFGALLALGIAQVIASLWDRPRPCEAHPGDAHPLLSPSPDPPFPSDHATGAQAIAVAILLRHRTGGVPALILATLVAISRVALGTHYPTDVLGGAALGALAALLLWAPPIRRPLHRIADRTGPLYDRATGSLRSKGAHARRRDSARLAASGEALRGSDVTPHIAIGAPSPIDRRRGVERCVPAALRLTTVVRGRVSRRAAADCGLRPSQSPRSRAGSRGRARRPPHARFCPSSAASRAH